MSVRENFKKFKNEFLAIVKRILKRDISKNPTKLKEYETDVIGTYNDAVGLIDEYFETLNEDEKIYFKSEVLYIREKLLLCFGKLNLTYTLPEDLYEKLIQENLVDNTLTDDDFEDTETDTNTSNSELIGFVNNINGNGEVSTERDEQNSTLGDTNTTRGNNSIINSQNNNTNMSQKENREFLRFAAQALNKNYAGDPLGLKSFVNSVELIKATAETNQTDLFKQFVISRLEGRALECIDQSKNLENIIADLQNSIKPDSSKVVEGKMLSLRLNKSHANDFSKQAEELAEALQRSLVVEGYSLSKAKEITVEKTVEMCRQNARNEFVKSVLAARDFKDPKEVVAKLIIEQNSQEKERQILFYKTKSNPQKKPFYKNNFNQHQNQQNNGQWKKFNGNNRGRFGRGRGHFRGNRSENRRQYNVRVAENYDVPSGSRREESNEPHVTLERVSIQ